MTQKKTFVTPTGLEELKKEYDDLVQVKRPQVVKRVSDAREMGDLSENAEYSAAREELSFIDGRIEELEVLLKQVVIIDDSKNKANVVKLGSQVTVKLNGKEIYYTIVGEWEANPAEKKISHESPLGKSLMGKKAGDRVEVTAPSGKHTYSIEQIH